MSVQKGNYEAAQNDRHEAICAGDSMYSKAMLTVWMVSQPTACTDDGGLNSALDDCAGSCAMPRRRIMYFLDAIT
jgi:hypothetical protein